jgi:CRISPR-associated protein (TIGR03986 family)
LADKLKAAVSNSNSDLGASLRDAIEKSEASKREDERRDRLAEKTKGLLLLPHSYGTGNFDNPLSSGFVNPYSFFPLERQGPQRRAVDGRELSGKLTCRVEVQDWSPLFVPNTSGVFELLIDGDENKVHKSYDFYSYDDLSEAAQGSTGLPKVGPSEPVIPGSELRGMTRSIYEQLTNSCMPITDEKSNPIKRTNLPKHPYRMEWDGATGEWKLYETEVYKLGAKEAYAQFRVVNMHGSTVTQNIAAYRRLRSGYEHQFVPGTGSIVRQKLTCDPSATGRYRGEVCDSGSAWTAAPEFYLHVTGEIGGRRNHNHLLMYPVVNAHAGSPLCSIREEDRLYRRFERVVDAYCEDSTIDNHKKAIPIYKAYRALLKAHQPVLVYADDDKNPLHLAPSAMSPESFDTRIVDLMGRHRPCTGPAFCPTCRLFGMVGTQGQIGSRVRFSDAHIQEGTTFGFLEPTTLAPLAGPRPSATEFYLKKPDGVEDGIWNYDYVLRGKVDNHGNRYLEKDATPYKDMPGAGIQGRKLYLHSPFAQAERYTPEAFKKSTQNVTVRPLKEGTFVFDVYFTDLSAHELATLAFALGGMGGGRLQKLGRGKPLGMGSVRVRVQSCEVKSYTFADGKVACTKSERDEGWFKRNLPDDEASKARRKLVVFYAQDLRSIPHNGSSLGAMVSYPKPKRGPICSDVNSPLRNQTFEWFRSNRGSVLSPNFSNTLGTLSVEEVMEDEVWSTLSEQ